MRKINYSLLVSILLLGIFPAILSADATSDAAARITQRLAQIDSLKADGLIGENAKGFLVERGTLGARQASIVSDENKDRMVIYKSIAERTGQSPDEVGVQRALQIAQRANRGVWLQRPSGDWYQKS